MRTSCAFSRLLLASAILAVAATAVWVLAPATAQPKKPIKIGFLAPLTGGAAQVGRDTVDRKSTRLNSSHSRASRMPSSA